MSLGEAQKKYLRGLGHALKPSIMIGDAGLSASVLAEYESTIAHHELLKIKIRGGDRSARDTIVASLCSGENPATLVQRVGNVALLYRANLQKKPDKRLRIPT